MRTTLVLICADYCAILHALLDCLINMTTEDVVRLPLNLIVWKIVTEIITGWW